MNIHHLVAPAFCVGALLGCSTPQPPVVQPPLSMRQFFGPLAPPSTIAPPVQACHVGTRSCMDLDARPFAPCLLTEQHCPRDAEFIPLDSDKMALDNHLKPNPIEPPKD